MKLRMTLFLLLLCTGLSAQFDLKSLIGSWKVKSFIQDGKTLNATNTYFRYKVSDVGDYLLEQVLMENKKEKCVGTAMLMESGTNEVDHSYLMNTDDENPLCTFWIHGYHTYELKNGVLYINSKEDKIELTRK